MFPYFILNNSLLVMNASQKNNLDKFTLDNVTTKVRKLIHDVFELTSEIEDTTPFSSFTTVCELRRLEIVVLIETHFPVSHVPEEVWDQLVSIQAIVDWLMNNIQDDLAVSADEYSSYLEELESEESSEEGLDDDESQ